MWPLRHCHRKPGSANRSLCESRRDLDQPTLAWTPQAPTESGTAGLRRYDEDEIKVAKPHDRLVPVSSAGYPASTPGLSTTWSTWGLQGPEGPGIPNLEVVFPLRSFQRLSLPDIATRRCGWGHNRNTSGPSSPVLSHQGPILPPFLSPRQIGTKLSHDVLNPARVPL